MFADSRALRVALLVTAAYHAGAAAGTIIGLINLRRITRV